MANQFQLHLLQQGSSTWNQWRSQSPGIQPDLRGAILSGLDLNEANLSETNLRGAALRGVSLRKTTFWQASLRGADLYRADLTHAYLYQTDLKQADLSESNLNQANFREALLGGTNFANVNLSTVKGLETIQHVGRSYIDIHTLYRSQGQLPEVFLRGIGIPEHFILTIHPLFDTPISRLSCFISSSTHDAAFVARLQSDLLKQGVRCWSILHDPHPHTEDDFKRLKETFQLDDVWLLIFSEYTIANEWIKHEIQSMMALEHRQNRTIIFPICLTQDALDIASNGPFSLPQDRQIQNFTNWQDDTTYQDAFAALLDIITPKLP